MKSLPSKVRVHRQTPTSLRIFSLLILIALTAAVILSQNYQQSPSLNSHVIIKPHRVVLPRKPEFQRGHKSNETVVIYPEIAGLDLAAVLGRVQELLRVENVFGSSLEKYREDGWLDEFWYKVNYNNDHILDITFTQSGRAAYPDVQSKHFAIDLRTGEQLNAETVFKPASIQTLIDLIDSRLQAEVISLKRRAFSELKKNDAENIYGALEKQKFGREDLDDFSVSNKGITFLYNAGFPLVIRKFQPSGRYYFSYSALREHIKPDGPLGQFLR